MKVTKSYIKQLIREELETVLKENSEVYGNFDIVPEGPKNMDRLAWMINGKSGNISGSQSLVIAILGFAKKKAGQWEEGPEPAELAQNASRLWCNYLKTDHDINIDPPVFAAALMDGSIGVRLNKPPQDTNFSY